MDRHERALAARDRRHRLDRQLVLLRPPGFQHQAERRGCPRAPAARPGRSTAAASITWSNIWWRPSASRTSLTWFKWEAYATWLSGFALLVIVYYFGAELYLIDTHVLDLPVWGAVLISLVGLALGWLVYDGLCKSPLGEHDVQLAAAGFAFLVALAYGFTLLFSGRGAYMQMGALIGTMMVANVFMVIIPNQKKVVADLIAGREPDPKLGQQAKQRSLHNNYLTLPVLFVMISNHYPLAFASRWNWVIFALVLVVGAVIRHFYNERHAGRPNPWWTWFVATAGMLLIVWLSTAAPLEEVEETASCRAGRARRRRGREHRPVALQHVPRRRAVVGGHRGAAQGRHARHAGTDPPARPRDPPAGGADPCHAARQHHRDRAGRAPASGRLVRRRRAGRVRRARCPVPCAGRCAASC